MQDEPAFRRYEHQVVASCVQSLATVTTAWHWRCVPTSVLLACGWLPSPEAIAAWRRKRLVSHDDEYEEFGLDGIALRQDGSYYGIQAKCYKPPSSIGSTLGSYAAAVLTMKRKNPLNGGVLYYPPGCRLTHNYGIAVDCPEDNMLICQLAPDNNVVVDDVQSQWALETTYKLHPIQELAVEHLRMHRCAILSMICGVGKTIICATHVRNMGYDVVVVATPLIASAQQNRDRFAPFLKPQRQVVSFWSGAGATLDSATLSNALKSKDKVLVCTTYASANEVYSIMKEVDALKDKRVLVVMDEAHNIGDGEEGDGRAQQLAFNDRDWDTILVTATPSASLRKHLIPQDCDTTSFSEFNFSMSQAIQDRLIVDYTLSMPLVTDNQSFMPVELSCLDARTSGKWDAMGRALFLAGSMYHDGARRCIVFCNTKEECRAMEEAFEQVCREYLGVLSWTGRITEEVSSRERQAILSEFQADDSVRQTKLQMVTSIRILDEAIDIPRCDSVFFTSVASSVRECTWIRAVQRLNRATRVDPLNPTKTARAYLWTPGCDEDSLSNLLWCLKDSDPHVFSKVRMQSADYDRAVANKEVDSLCWDARQEWVQKYSVKAVSPPTMEQKITVLLQKYDKVRPNKKEEHTFTVMDAGTSFQWKVGSFVDSLLQGGVKRLSQADLARLKSGCEWLPRCLATLEALREEKQGKYKPTTADRVAILLQHFRNAPPKVKAEDDFTIDRPGAVSLTFKCKIGHFMGNLLAGQIKLSEEEWAELKSGCEWLPARMAHQEEQRVRKQGQYMPTTSDRVAVLLQHYRDAPPTCTTEDDFTIDRPEAVSVTFNCKIGQFLTGLLAGQVKLSEEKWAELKNGCQWLLPRMTHLEAERVRKQGKYKPSTSDRLEVLVQHYRDAPPQQKTEEVFTIAKPGAGTVTFNCKIGQFLASLLVGKVKLSEEEWAMLRSECKWLAGRMAALEVQRKLKQGQYQATVADKVAVLRQHYHHAPPKKRTEGEFTTGTVRFRCKIGLFLEDLLSGHTKLSKEVWSELKADCKWLPERMAKRKGPC